MSGFTEHGLTDPGGFVGAMMRKTSNQGPITDDTDTTITWETVSWDTAGLADTTNNRFTIPSGLDGFYELHVGISCSGGSADGSFLRVAVNSTNQVSDGQDLDGFSPNQSMSTPPLQLNSGDNVTAIVFQNIGRTITVNNNTFFAIKRTGPSPR